MNPSQDLCRYAKRVGRDLSFPPKHIVCVQGMGFVGVAMALVVANAKDEKKELLFNVVGVDLPTHEGKQKIESINAGKLYFDSVDEKLKEAINRSYKKGNFFATSEFEVFSLADVIIVDIELDLEIFDGEPKIDFNNFRSAIKEISLQAKPGALVIIETTVPPGTCEQIVWPELKTGLKKRNLPEDALLLAHSYERVMPGPQYFDSIANFWRVYSGYNSQSAKACESFLKKIVNVQSYPLTKLSSLAASETAKVLENSYRAVNIAFMEEWGSFAEFVGINLFDVIEAIRKRPTHDNIREPGFGVGGYCLTKDPMFALYSIKNFYEKKDFNFPLTVQGIHINQKMSENNAKKLVEIFGGSLHNKTILLLGISYKEGVSDTRFSPTERFYDLLISEGAKVICHDPLVKLWKEKNIKPEQKMPLVKGIDGIVLAVKHSAYKNFDFLKWIENETPLFFDANNVLSLENKKILNDRGCKVFSVGSGIV